MPRKILPVVAIVGAIAAPFSAPAADRATEPFPAMGREDAERLREAGEQACQQIVEGAAHLGAQLHALSHDLSRQMLQAQDLFRREVAPALRNLSEQLEALARELERSPAKR